MSVKSKETAINWIEQSKDKIIEISDSLWGFAELGLLEHKSAQLMIETLETHGFTITHPVGGLPTAFIAEYGEGKPVIGIMGEYDALPGLNQTRSPRKEASKVGAPGHGCGHNIHGTSGLAGVIAIRYAMEAHDLPGTVKFFGTPAEESASGKVWMVREGVFQGVDAVLSHHPSSMNYGSLASSLANNSVKFHFTGKTSHAAGSPEQGRSALDAVELMNVGVNYLREHIIQEARIHYIIEEGGGQPNVVPGYANSWYLVRAPERHQVDQIYKRVLRIAEGATMMTDTELEVEFIKGIYNKIPSETLSNIVNKNMREIGSPRYTEKELDWARELTKSVSLNSKIGSLRKSGRPDWNKLVDTVMDTSIPEAWNEGVVSPGSTDVSDVSWMAPTMEFQTAAWPLGTPGHSWMIVAASAHSIGHKSLLFSAKVLASSGLDLLTDSEVREQAWREHGERLQGKDYRSPIPEGMAPPLDLWDE